MVGEFSGFVRPTEADSAQAEGVICTSSFLWGLGYDFQDELRRMIGTVGVLRNMPSGQPYLAGSLNVGNVRVRWWSMEIPRADDAEAIFHSPTVAVMCCGEVEL